MNYLMELFGDVAVNGITVATLLLLIGAIVFLVKLYRKAKKDIIDKHTQDSEREEKINKTFEEVSKYHEYRLHDREQSREIQAQLIKAIAEMRQAQQENFDHLKELDKRIISYELADTRDKLLQNYRYFTSPHNNPMQAWTELEHEAFFELLKTYEENGGDGYMHTVVQPAMELLRVIPMSHLDEITELMHSRK